MNYSPTNSIQSQDRSNGALFQGVALATVTNTSKLSEGIVKIEFEWMKNQDIEAQIITSNKDSTLSIDVNDVVLVAFEQDIFEFPWILGFIYPLRKNKEP